MGLRPKVRQGLGVPKGRGALKGLGAEAPAGAEAAGPGRRPVQRQGGGAPALNQRLSRSSLAALCARLAAGEPLSLACRDPSLPCEPVVREAMAVDPKLAATIAAARDAGFDAIAARARLTARGVGDSTDNVARDKLIIDTDLKLLARWDPRRYGDRPSTEPPAEPAQDQTWPDNETAARLAAILEAAKIRKGEG
jgi:hypothetical protein